MEGWGPGIWKPLGAGKEAGLSLFLPGSAPRVSSLHLAEAAPRSPVYSFTPKEGQVFGLTARLQVLGTGFNLFYFGHEDCGISVPQPGIEPRPSAVKPQVLTAGPPGSPLGIGLIGLALVIAHSNAIQSCTGQQRHLVSTSTPNSGPAGWTLLAHIIQIMLPRNPAETRVRQARSNLQGTKKVCKHRI